MVHGRAFTTIRNTFNSKTIKNRTHMDINIVDHTELDNHLLQLCPQVMNHSVYIFVLKKRKTIHIYRGQYFVLSVGACTFVDFFYRFYGFLPSSLFQFTGNVISDK
jgi:hypothetical protein